MAVDNRFRQLSHIITFAPTGLAMIWLVVVIIAGLVLGKLRGFMTVEFVMRPLPLIVRWAAALFGAIVEWVVGYPDSEQ